jgi:hypothetical protein
VDHIVIHTACLTMLAIGIMKEPLDAARLFVLCF